MSGFRLKLTLRGANAPCWETPSTNPNCTHAGDFEGSGKVYRQREVAEYAALQWRQNRHVEAVEIVPARPSKFYLRRLYLNRGGYDSTGAYWRHGAPLYEFGSELDSAVTGTLRALNREAARQHVRNAYPGATFHR